jgi:hypothetical protein
MHDEAEIEGDEDMDENEESECPYCGSDDDCPHLFTCIDKSFGEWQGGYAYDRSDEFSATVLKTFEERRRTGAGPHPAWAANELGEIWDFAVEQYKEGEMMWVNDGPLLRLLCEIFQDAGAHEIEAVWGEDRPGYTSAVTIFYAKDPAAVFDESLRRLNQLLDP